MKKHFQGIVLLILVCAPWPTQSQETRSSSPQLETQKAFFNNLRKMCGQRFEGATDFPQNADHPMAGKKLVMLVGACAEKEIRIPFQVGEDKSRTWILTLGDKGLMFKHDHRHPDGTPDQITMYGGWASAHGTRYLQRFPADPDTVKLIPEAATNVWTLQIIPEKQQFMYYLERNSQPRYRAYFKLKPLSLSQQNPKAPAFTSLFTLSVGHRDPDAEGYPQITRITRISKTRGLGSRGSCRQEQKAARASCSCLASAFAS